MSKIIKLTSEHIESIRDDFNTALEKVKLSDGKFTFSKTIDKVDRKAELCFTEKAWIKMYALVDSFDKEVAWHGLAKRGDDPEKDEYIVYDILVYPQEASSATVNTDQEKYQMWLMMNEDEVFNNIRMQGHSHVNMSTSPSGVDTSLYERILEQLEDDMFYIFLITNKRKERTIKIYDMQKNVLFETGDIDVFTIDDGTGLDAFLKEAKEMVKDQVTVAKNNTKSNNTTQTKANSQPSKTAGGGKKKKKKKTAGYNSKGNYGFVYDGSQDKSYYF